MHKRFLVLFITILALISGGALFYIYADSVNYWKVTDPLDSRFDPDKFVFNDYGSHKELAEALKILIRPGMPRAEAEKFLDGSPDKRGGRDVTADRDQILKNLLIKQKIDTKAEKINVEALKTQTRKIFFYAHGGKWKLMNPAFGWSVTVFYDEEDRVLQIITASEVLFDEKGIL